MLFKRCHLRGRADGVKVVLTADTEVFTNHPTATGSHKVFVCIIHNNVTVDACTRQTSILLFALTHTPPPWSSLWSNDAVVVYGHPTTIFRPNLWTFVKQKQKPTCRALRWESA
jgi:hypothetical protein